MKMRTPVPWALAAVPIWLAGAVLAVWADAAIVKRIHRGLTPALDAFFDGVSDLADATALAVVAMAIWGASHVALAWPAARHRGALWAQARRGSLLMLLTLLTGGGVTLALKQVVARARPFMLLEHGHYGLAAPFSGAPFDSFPSSHAFTAFAAAGVLARLFPAWRVALLAFALTVALCRVLTLAHFPSDVLASACIAAWCVRFWAPRLQGAMPDHRS